MTEPIQSGLPEGLPEVPWSGTLPGWWPIIKRCHERLIEVDPEYRIDQIKEKFGGLRYYVTPSAPEHYEKLRPIISAAEAESGRTCEVCGSEGTQRGTGWIVTLCGTCGDKWEAGKRPWIEGWSA